MNIFKKKTEHTVSPYLQEQAENILSALGGKENVTRINACITRLRLDIIDFSKIDEDRLNELGSKGNVKQGNNQLHIILGKNADKVAQLINNM